MPENKLFRAAKQGDLTLLVACMATSNVNINAQNQVNLENIHTKFTIDYPSTSSLCPSIFASQ